MSTISACGNNEHAQLGKGAKSHSVLRPQVVLPTWSEIVQIVVSASHTVGFFPDAHAELVGGNVYGTACNGTQHDAELTPVRLELPPLRAIIVREAHGVALTVEGEPRTWGGNNLGQAGMGTSSEGAEMFKPPGCYPTAQSPYFDRRLAVVGGGDFHSLAITTDGQPAGAGRNDAGQLGDGTHSGKLIFTHAVAQDEPVIALAGGAKHSLFLRGDGRALGAGRPTHGQFGDPDETADWLEPKLIDAVEGVLAVAAGASISLFLLEDGTVMECGLDQPLHKIDLPGPATWISAGPLASRAAVVQGEAFTWGDGEYGKLGDGTREDKAAPVALNLAARMVECGPTHTVFVD